MSGRNRQELEVIARLVNTPGGALAFLVLSVLITGWLEGRA